MKNRPGFCYEIFKNQAYWSLSDGSVGYNPCSFYDGMVDTNVPPEQSWHGKNHKALIKIIEKDQRIEGCHRCYHEEAAGRISRRQSSAVNYEQYLQSTSIEPMSGPEGLDYSIGNLCNLKCIICGPQNSTAWIPDYQKMHPGKDLSAYLFRHEKTTEIKNTDFLKNIRSLHFHGGGEPLMSDAHQELLLKVKDAKGLSDVRVFYNTNGTKIVSQEILALWEQCQQIELYFSIDDVGTRFEYQRSGAKWQSVCENINWFRSNMPHNHLFNVNCVWSFLNIFYLDELVAWHRDFLPSNRYGDACNLIFQKAIGDFGISCLNARAMHALGEKFADKPNLLSLLNGIAVSDDPQHKFWQAIGRIDVVRHTDFKSICPEWSTLI